MDMLSLRAGYKLNYSGTDESPVSGTSVNSTIEGVSLGGGVRTTFQEFNVAVDYSFTEMKLLKDAHRFTIRIGMK
jgi:hypothetical protein